MNNKIAALASFLGCEPEDITEESYDHYGLTLFSTPEGDYAVGTDAEAQEAAKSYIEDSLWAFNAEFILSECGLPFDLEEMLQAYQSQKCEGANDAIKSLIEKCGDMDSFVESAISADGRGHFLSPYDGVECEEGEFFIYRTN